MKSVSPASLLLLPLLAMAALLSSCTSINSTARATDNTVIGSYLATVAQTRLAAARADRFYSQLTPAEKATLAQTHVRYVAVQTEKPTFSQISDIKKSIKASPEIAAKYGVEVSTNGPWELTKPVYCMMIWDTETKQVVGSECFALLEVPASGTMARFDTYSAQIIPTSN